MLEVEELASMVELTVASLPPRPREIFRVVDAVDQEMEMAKQVRPLALFAR